MANYRYDKISNDRFKVIETKTNLVLLNDVCYNKARETTKKLNSGAGFQGFTPEFFLNDVEKFSSSW
jgi:hypothetical protein